MATSTETSVDLAINTIQSENELIELEETSQLEPYNIFFIPAGNDEPEADLAQIILRRWDD